MIGYGLVLVALAALFSGGGVMWWLKDAQIKRHDAQAQQALAACAADREIAVAVNEDNVKKFKQEREDWSAWVTVLEEEGKSAGAQKDKLLSERKARLEALAADSAAQRSAKPGPSDEKCEDFVKRIYGDARDFEARQKLWGETLLEGREKLWGEPGADRLQVK